VVLYALHHLLEYVLALGARKPTRLQLAHGALHLVMFFARFLDEACPFLP
jgi:hypothetical protein